VGEAIASPGALARLEELDLSRNRVDVGGLSGLVAGLRAPGALPSVRTINLVHVALTHEHMQCIAEAIGTPGALPSLQVLALQARWLSEPCVQPCLDARPRLHFME
jgi:hypothetical protein